MAFLGNFNIIAAIDLDELNVNKLSAEIISSGSVNGFTNISHTEGFPDFTVYGGSVISQVNLEAVIFAHVAVTLAEHKVFKNDAIDARTTELIFEGYTYGVIVLSASIRAQQNLDEYFLMKDEPSFTYPKRLNSIDNTGFLDIADSLDLITIYDAYLAMKQGHFDTGTVYKNAVRIAATKGEVDLVIDIR